MNIMHSMPIPGQEPLRVDKFLMNRIENATRNKIQQGAKVRSSIHSQRKCPVKSNYKVKGGDRVRVVFSHPPHENLLAPEELMDLDIVYEDDDLDCGQQTGGDGGTSWTWKLQRNIDQRFVASF